MRRPGPAFWWVLVIVTLTLAGALAGAVVDREMTPTYVANSTILVGSLDRSDLGSEFPTSAMVTAIYARLIRSGAVLEPVIARTGYGTDAQTLRDRVHVDVAPNDVPIITVTVYAPSADEALAITNAITERMQELRRTGGTAGPAANDIHVLQPAAPLGGKIRPLLPFSVTLGTAIGCLGGCALLAAWAARRRRRARSIVAARAVDPWAAELGYAAHAR